MEPPQKSSVQNATNHESNGGRPYCFNCGMELVPASARYCPYCGAAQDQMPPEPKAEVSPAEVSLIQRTKALNESIAHFTAQGFHIVAKTETSAQLMRPKQFSWLAAILSLLVLGIGFVIYLVYYWGQKDETIFLEVTPDGTVLKDGCPFSTIAEARPLKPSVEVPSIEVEPEESREQIEARRLGWPLLVAIVVGMILLISAAVCLAMVFRGFPPKPYPASTPSPTFTAYPTHTPRPSVVVTPTPIASPISPTPIVHVVEPGDTLSAIASIYRTAAEDICAFNQLTDCRLITPGQELMIPGAGVVLPSPTKAQPPPSPTPSPLATQTPSAEEGIMQVTSHGTTWDAKMVSVEKETMLRSTFSDDVTYAAGEYWILTLEVINRGRRTDSFIVVDLELRPSAGGAVYEEDHIATLYVEAARDMGLAAYKIHPGGVGYAVKVFDVPVGTTELILRSRGTTSHSEGTLVVRP